MAVTGKLWIKSPTAALKTNFFPHCVQADPNEKLSAESARLSFSSDEQGATVIGASGVTGTPFLEATTVNGKQICAWVVNFGTGLPVGTAIFYIHYGYTGYYWGPYSQYEAVSPINITFDH